MRARPTILLPHRPRRARRGLDGRDVGAAVALLAVAASAGLLALIAWPWAVVLVGLVVTAPRRAEGA